MSEIKRNIVITGFMGAGKTTVGLLLAERLGWPFVDMDAIIEEREGRSISEIFASDGEPYFRRLETSLCRELAAWRSLVIATGGGALVNTANLTIMAGTGLVVCLGCALDNLLQRIPQDGTRPLLATPDRRQRLLTLLEARREAYERIPHHLDTTLLTPSQVAEAILELYQSTDYSTTVVHYPGGSYPIYQREGLLQRAGELLAWLGWTGTVAVVTNPTVGAIYGEPLRESLVGAGFAPALCEMPDGEIHKTLDTVSKLYSSFVRAGLDRGSLVIALGGGVLGDTAGFAAATFMRGLPFVQVPTSLLAMVDSSVGGKVGVDLPEGKNLVGAFKQPVAVVVDPALLATLSPFELRSGMAEVVKAGVIGSPTLLEAIERQSQNLAWMIDRAIKVKIAVVEEDPYEQGRRAVLNLGHTFGHAFELLSGYRMRHGEAVSAGMIVAARLAVALGRCDWGTVARIEKALTRLGLPVRSPDFEPEAVWRAMSADKKKRGGRLRFVLPEEIGHVVVVDDVPKEAVLKTLLISRGSR
jgi:shikimate kinase/3-dehydroquinate synthase